MQIDTTQHYLQLKALGYKDGDTIFYRQFPPKGSKGYASKTKQILPCIIQEQNPEKGLYFVVNGQGQSDKDIKTCRAFFAEWDDRPMEEQEDFWEKINFLEPTFQVKTRKSIHSYWVLKEPIPVEDWKILQANLLNFLDGDRTLKNPSRVLRVAGGWHIKPGEEPVKCELINPTDRRYSKAEIEQALAAKDWTLQIPLVPPIQKPARRSPKIKHSVSSPLDDLERDKQLALEILEFLPPTVPDSGTYAEYREIAVALKNIFSEPEAIMLMTGHSPERNWQQIIPSSTGDFGIGTLVHHARTMLGWDYPQWWKDSMKSEAKPGAKKVEVTTTIPLQEPSEYYDDDEGIPGQEGKGESYRDPAVSWKEKAYLDCFFDAEYISFGDDTKLSLYRYNGQYYEKFSRAEAEALLIEWAYQNPVKGKYGKWVAAHLSPQSINGAYEWTLKRKRVKEELINPPGINLANGRLIIQWEKSVPKAVIEPHTSKVFYTYCSPVKYDPNANPENCDRLLSCISPEEQTIFLRSVALAFDLENFRRFTGRPRALFLEGVGENGKDSLRLVVEQIFGQFMVDTALNNFYQFEQGQIGGLADLDGALVSWASENSDQYKVEKLKSLFRLISGEQVKINPKGRDERTIKPNAVFFFNVNEAPRMDGSLNAMTSRFCVIRFQKSFKRNPNPADSREMQADPRFKYDPQWVVENVSPAFLNRVLAEIPAIAQDGIPYEGLDHYFQEIRKKSNHLWEFVEEMGIVEAQGEKIYISDLWLILREWYEANGTLEVIQPETDKGRPKLIWHEQLKRFDRPIKGANQIFDAFSQLFPKITKQRETIDKDKKGSFYLAGLKLNKTASPASLPYSIGVTASPMSSLSFTSSSPEKKEEEEKRGGQKVGEAVGEAISEAVDGLKPLPDRLVKQVKQFEGVYTSPEISNGKKVELTEDQKLTASEIKAEMDRLQLNPWQLQRICKERYEKSTFLEINESEQLDLILYLKSKEA
ncbi:MULTISPECIES: DUF5906 domain-containing protein [unclassified Synechocystis]|uniref:DUF5906 domain-containing protein n=1 Tax=unclassified Synechocystis TaxID=2640012 RepID=UPI000418D1DB|nr:MULTISPECIES: DUF5906 domain-containing protein [unclassified Synechocystis]AIE73857.1 hypothetical protein D082_13290 [Synechocystis sp. PCC 6714]MCT0252331.1 hypothetical protein [Synechocystis sp. CS-94]